MTRPVSPSLTSRLPWVATFRLGLGFMALLICVGANRSRWDRIPAPYRRKPNPYAGQADAIAAGHRLFLEDCAQCHQRDAMGKGKRPSLRSNFVQRATDGELFWVLRNGILRRGMPSWSMLPEPERWQIIAYVKSLGPGTRVSERRTTTSNSKNISAAKQGSSK